MTGGHPIFAIYGVSVAGMTPKGASHVRSAPCKLGARHCTIPLGAQTSTSVGTIGLYAASGTNHNIEVAATPSTAMGKCPAAHEEYGPRGQYLQMSATVVPIRRAAHVRMVPADATHTLTGNELPVLLATCLSCPVTLPGVVRHATLVTITRE